MKKSIALILILGLLLSGCNFLPGDTKQAVDTQTNSQQNKVNTQNGQDKSDAAKDASTNVGNNDGKENSKVPVQNEIFNDASVEALVQLGEDFLDAAFAGDIDQMIVFCNDMLMEKIEKSPKLYIGTKPNYKIDKVDTAIKMLGNGKYLLQSTVSTLKKSDKKKFEFKYSMTAEKVKGDYQLTEFKRENN